MHTQGEGKSGIKQLWKECCIHVSVVEVWSCETYLVSLSYRLGSGHSSHHKCSRCVLDGSLCSPSSRYALQECKGCQELGKCRVQGASGKFLPGVCQASSSNQLEPEDLVSVWQAWHSHNRCGVLEQCRARVRDQLSSSSRMCVTSHRHTQEQCPCSLKSRCNRPSTYL